MSLALPTSQAPATPTRAVISEVSRSARHLTRRSQALAVFATLAPIALFIAMFGFLRATAMAEGHERLAALLEIAARQAEAVLDTDAEIARVLAIGLGADQAGRIDAASLQPRLAAIAQRHEQIAEILVLDRAGTIIAHSGAAGDRVLADLPAPSLATVPEIAAILAGENGPRLVHPFGTTLQGEPQFGLVAAIERGGVVDGAVLVGISSGFLSRYYEGVEPFAEFRVTWFDHQGWILARRPVAPRPVQLPPQASPLVRLVGSGVREGRYSRIATDDGVERLVHFRTLDAWPVTVAVAASRARMVAANDRTAAGFGLILLVAAGTIGFFARSLRHNAAAHGELIECLARADQARQLAEDQLHQAQKLEAIGLLTGGVAHDFNNLLTVLLGCSETLHDRFRDDTPARDTIELMLQTVERGAELTGQLLTFARKQMLFPVPCDIGKRIRQARTLLAKAAGEDTQLVTELSDMPLPVRVDPIHLDTCLINLVSNASEVSGHHDTITIRTYPHRIDTDAPDPDLPPGDYAVIDVEDQGKGMAPEVAERAFEPFFTTKPLGRGTGLGLSMVYGFARQSGGTARIASHPDRGTRVSVFLPRSDMAEAEPALRRPTAPTRIEAKLLLVDDDRAVRLVIAETLRGFGVEVTEAPDAATARRLLAEGRFDVMISDVVMPGDMNGYELASWARRSGHRLPILLISGFTRGQLPTPLSEAENLAFLAKPVSRAELGAKLHDLLNAASPGDGGGSTGG